MRSVPVGAALVCSIVSAWSTWSQETPAPIRLGDEKSGTLKSESRVFFDLVAPVRGEITILAESYDFDLQLRVEDEEGTLIGEDFDSGVETNAHLSILAEAAKRYRVTICPENEGFGEFTIRVESGRLPAPSPTEHRRLAVEYRERGVERALARNDRPSAVDHLLAQGVALAALSEAERARGILSRAVQIASQLQDRRLSGEALVDLADALSDLGGFEQAERAYTLARQTFGELDDRSAERRVLNNLANLFASGRRNLPRAREMHLLLLEDSRECEDTEGELSALINLGALSNDLGDFAAGIDYIEQARGVARRFGSKEERVMVLVNLGRALEPRGYHRQARDCFLDALTAARELGRRDFESVAQMNLGSVEQRLGDLEAARVHFEQALGISRAIGHRTHEMWALGYAGQLAEVLGHFGEAEEAYRSKLEIAIQLGSRGDIGWSELGLGYLSWTVGDAVRAREHLERALAVGRETGDRPLEVKALGALFDILLWLGEGEGAEAYAKRHLDLAQQMGDRAQIAVALRALSRVDEQLHGDLDQARSRADEALALFQELGDVPGQIATLSVMGDRAHSSGQVQAALSCFERARSLCQGRPQAAWFEASLARSRFELGEHAQAESLALSALSRMQHLGLERWRLEPLQILVALSLIRRDAEAAAGWLDQADELLDRDSLSRLELSHRLHVRAQSALWERLSQEVTMLQLESPVGRGEDASAILQLGFRRGDRWKGRSLLEGIFEHSVGGRTSEILALRKRWRQRLSSRDRILERIAEAIVAEAPADEIDRMRADAERYRKEADELKKAIEAATPEGAVTELVHDISARQVQDRLLDERTALIEFVEGEGNLYGYVLTPSKIDLVDLGDLRKLSSDLERFIAGLQGSGGLAALAALERQGHLLYRAMLDPLLSIVGRGLDRLIIISTPELSTFPFEALVVEPGKNGTEAIYVIDRYEVSYGLSSSILLQIGARGPRRSAGGVLVLADPVYPTEGEVLASMASKPTLPPSILGGMANRNAPDPAQFRRLEHSRDEALALGRLLVELGERREDRAIDLLRLSERRSGSLSTNLMTLHLGMDASPDALRGDLRPFAILHVAGHAYTDADHPQRSGLALSFIGDQSGFFTLDEVLDLDLDANLVVLSACETARGERLPGEGVQSLAWAFFYCGARSVVASLWPVSDRHTASTMVTFYQELLGEGLCPSSALRQAKLSIRRRSNRRGVQAVDAVGATSPTSSAHPFFWAPFVHLGLPR